MKKIMIIAALLLTIVATSFAAPVKMIREDRVWEYVYIYSNDYGRTRSCRQYKMKFDGTEVLNGKTYHKFGYTGRQLTWTDSALYYDSENKRVVYGVKDLKETETNDDTYYLMREENRKVYVSAKSIHISKDDSPEYLVYDFNLKAGESYTGLWKLTYCGQGEFRVNSTDVATIENEKCCVQELEAGPVEVRKTATEGIGFNYGILPYLENYTGFDGPSSYTELNRVYDGKGNIIYRGLDRDVAGVNVVADGSDLEILVTESAIRVAAEGNVGVTVWCMQGSKVAGAEGAGEVSVSTSGLIPGVYVVRAVSADGRSATRKIVVK